jgi:hypothetical protein
MTVATTAFNDKAEGGRREGTGERDFLMTCSVVDSNTGFKPASHTSLKQNEEVFSAPCSWSWRRLQKSSSACPIWNYADPGWVSTGERFL